MAEAVEKRRRDRGLSPGGFADAAGLTPQGLAPVRAGQRKRYEDKTIVGVAKALAWSMDWYDRLVAGQFPDEVDDRGEKAPWEELLAQQREISEKLERIADLLEGNGR